MNKIRKGSQTARTNIRRLYEPQICQNYINQTIQNTIQPSQNSYDTQIPIKFTHTILHANKNILNNGRKLYNCYSQQYYDKRNCDENKNREPISLFSIAQFNRKKCLSQSLRKRKYKIQDKQMALQQKYHFQTPFISRQCKTAKNRKFRQKIKNHNTLEVKLQDSTFQLNRSDYIKIAYQKKLQKIIKKNNQNISQGIYEKQKIEPIKKYSQLSHKQKLTSISYEKDIIMEKRIKIKEIKKQKDYLRPWSGFNNLTNNQTQLL